MHVCMYIIICVCVCVHDCMCACTYMHMCVCVRDYMCACTCIYYRRGGGNHYSGLELYVHMYLWPIIIIQLLAWVWGGDCQGGFTLSK